MLFSYNWLQSFFDKKLPEPKELARLIVGHCFEVEKMEKAGKDTIFDISILSNRPDCMAHIGIAREIAAILGYKLNLPKVKKIKARSTVAARSMVDIQVADKIACPRYSAKVVTGVKVGPSPKWIKDRLEACGLRAINNIVDVTNYVMLETGQPLHAFDWDKLAAGRGKAKKIIVRYAADGEKIDALGEKKYELLPSVLLITDEAGPLAIAGIKGGKRAEISEKTTTIVLESANFNQKLVRLASRSIGLTTDASVRFAHDLDRGQTLEIAERAADLMAQVSGGQVMAGAVDYNPNPAKPKEIILEMRKAECLLGREVQTARTKKILELLGFSVRKGKKLDLEVTVPTRRTDVLIPEDLIEEIGRVDGYEKIMAIPARGLILPPAVNYFWLWKTVIRDAMIAAGWSQARNYTFVSETDCRNFGYDLKDILKIENPVNEDVGFMRPSLLINLAKNITANPTRENLSQFEIGKIFGVAKRDEPTMFAGISKSGTFFEMKGAIEFVLRRLGIADYFFEPLNAEGDIAGSDIYNPTRSARLMSGRNLIGTAGQLSNGITAAIGIRPVMVFELSVDALAKLATRRNDYKPISMHPAAIRDISIDVPAQTLAAAVIAVARKADAARLVRKVEITDKPYIYEGGKIKNMLLRFILQSNFKTLETKEINDWQERTINAIEAVPGWKVKK